MARSALEKLRDPKKKQQIEILESDMPFAPAGAKMLISTPAEIDALMARVPTGRVMTTDGIRRALAKRHQCDVTCPLTTGIFINIAARAAAELEEMGAKQITPWWRTVKADGRLNEKAPGGVAAQKARLEAEGVRLLPKGTRNFVVADLDQIDYRPRG